MLERRRQDMCAELKTLRLVDNSGSGNMNAKNRNKAGGNSGVKHIRGGSDGTSYNYSRPVKIRKNARRGSLENALVVDKDKIINKDGLRNENEFVNHKILDLAGDFMLTGKRVIGSVSCMHGGHLLTNDFLRKLLSDQSNFTVVENIQNISNLKKIAPNQKRIAVGIKTSFDKAKVLSHCFDPSLYKVSNSRRNESDNKIVFRYLGRFYGIRSANKFIEGIRFFIGKFTSGCM